MAQYSWITCFLGGKMDAAQTSLGHRYKLLEILNHLLIVCTLQAWDINNPKPKAADPGPFNILVAGHLSGTARNLPTALAKMYSNISEGGFLFLEEYTSPLGAAVYGFDESAWDHKDGRKFGPCTSASHWQQMLTKAGFTEVTVVR